MSRIDKVFAADGRKALIAYVTVGYPSLEATESIVPLLADAGCDVVELGIPFSDPMADGTTIQEASFQALQAGVTPAACLDVAGGIRRVTDVPLVFMTYYNPVLRFGLEAFGAACANAGVDGLIVPDLPPDEADDLDAVARRHRLDLIYLLTPTSTTERIQVIAEASSGFVYLVSLLGVTGARQDLPAELEGFIGRVRALTGKPLCVGFGISGPEQARRVARSADGVIVGSRLVQVMRDDTPWDGAPSHGAPPYDTVRTFIHDLRAAIDAG